MCSVCLRTTNKLQTHCVQGAIIFPIVKPFVFARTLFSFCTENTPYVSGRNSNLFVVERRQSERTRGDNQHQILSAKRK